MPMLIRRLLRSRLLLAVALPLAARGAAAAGHRLESTRGPSSTSRALLQTSQFLAPRRRPRGLLGRVLGR
ncbi:hypothetical protein CLV35_3888 [Motilibacter peucedani]|uniref:Uncharacterized protein n=1 Tax=Motilibacter peucedani TaxID=598650 RepID=A0A420XJQ1_9ACTN|nr:hypothetical protein [Motilibacter peucedani]RKS67981.1 hypothetical protein CLV35_3888 [Motilibacter peucedani]